MLNSRIKFILPFILLFALFGLLAEQLFYSNKNELPSALIGEDLPHFELPSLYSTNPLHSDKLSGQVSLLNVWASWCYACGIEMPMLMKIKNEYHIPIYGIAYRDNAEDAKTWLKENGNPYLLTGLDAKGNTAIDLGIYGIPETFIINPQGKIIYRHVGVIDQKNWDEILYPIIKRYEKN